MKNLYLMRHAKSSWKYGHLHDIQRPLSKRGKHDAPLMARALKDKNIMPGLIICSPAKRARSTAKRTARIFNIPKAAIQVDERIYQAGTPGLLKVIHAIHNDIRDVLLIGHNPDITELAEDLCSRDFGNIPTAGVVAIRFNIDSWERIKSGTGHVLFFEYPEMYR